MTIKYLFATLGIGVLLLGCSPKTAEPAVAVEEEQPSTQPTTPKPQDKNLSPCPKFRDAPNPDQASTNYVLYRDFLKAGDWDRAFDLWKRVYEVAPAADGQRNTVFADGIRFYEHFIAQTQDSLKREAYINRIFGLYDEIQECYPEGGYIPARKAFDYYYKYPDRKTKKEIYDMFKKAMDIDGLDTPDFVPNPFTSLLIDLYFEDEVSMEEARKYQQLVRDILAKGLEECEGVACDRWEIVKQYAPERLEYFETVKGFYDCEYYVDKYYEEFLASPTDCDVIRTVYSRLKWGGCAETDERFKEVIAAGNENCRIASASTPARLAYDCLREADYNCAIENFETAVSESDDIEKQTQYLMLIAKIYQTHLKNFPRSRQYALRAAELRPNWGEPYIHIGRLYASSGPLCGPGRGWDSQVVVWPAIDMWNKAKQVDPSVAAEANKWISRYAQYMPSREDIFQRTLNEGDTFRVGCWIQETTRIRAAN